VADLFTGADHAAALEPLLEDMDTSSASSNGPSQDTPLRDHPLLDQVTPQQQEQVVTRKNAQIAKLQEEVESLTLQHSKATSKVQSLSDLKSAAATKSFNKLQARLTRTAQNQKKKIDNLANTFTALTDKNAKLKQNAKATVPQSRPATNTSAKLEARVLELTRTVDRQKSKIDNQAQTIMKVTDNLVRLRESVKDKSEAKVVATAPQVSDSNLRSFI
jgi:chromosome segregation ATPase